MSIGRGWLPKLVASGAVGALFSAGVVVVGFAGAVVFASGASADPAPVAQRAVSSVTADALATAQINGVVWSQVVVGNTVYVAGSFTQARPAGVAVGGAGSVARGNLMAYDVRTGSIVSSFAPSLNAQAKVVAASPDGSRVYVGGSFTLANGLNRYRIAAYSTSNGQLISSFAPVLDATVNAITATNTTVYVGGAFSSANNNARARLAAFSAASGALLGWAPAAGNNEVEAMVLTPDASKVIVGGSFTTLNGSALGYGLGAIDATTGALVSSWAAPGTVKDAGTKAAVLSLSTDGSAIYGTGYVFGAGGNLEGAFSANPGTGAINWVEDCHGDTYSNFAVNGSVYVVGHAHYCGNVGGFPQTSPTWTFHHALEFSAAATGTLLHNSQSPGSYTDFGGQPSPTLDNWFPDLAPGTFTGQSQAAWSTSGNASYLVLGGEFPSVNGIAQQGLVRFAIPAKAPNKQAPMVSGANFKPTLRAISNSSVRVSWPANWDRDDQNLTYHVIRNGDVTHPIYTTTATSQFWNEPVLGYLDTGLTPGASYDYRLNVSDPSGNLVWGDTATVAVPTTSPWGAYAQQVLGDGAAHYWRFGEPSGSSAADLAGSNTMTAGAGTTPAQAGALLNDTDKARKFGGTTTGTAGTSTAVAGPDVYSSEAWFKTTSTTGGKIVGFGDSPTGSSSSYDRHVYLDNAGHLIYGVYDNSATTVISTGKYNDGQWHQVVATLSSQGMVLYADGVQLGANTTTTRGQVYNGYWRVGGDNLASWPSAPTSSYLNATIDEVAIYPTALNLAQVQAHYRSSGRTLTEGGAFHALAPARVLDTRSGVGAGAAAVKAGGVVSLSVLGHAGVPATHVSAVALHVTVTGPASRGYLTVWPASTPRPTVSTLDFAGGQTVANSVLVKVGTGGVVDLYNGSSGTVQLVADVAGYFDDSGGDGRGAFGTLAPARLLDTRHGIGGPVGPVQPGATIHVAVVGHGGVPSVNNGFGYAAAVLNVTAVNALSGGYVTVWPSGTRPATSNLNLAAGQTRANLVITGMDAGGGVNIYNGSAHPLQLVADVSGYFGAGALPNAANQFVAVSPSRVLDTRQGVGAHPVAPGATVSVQLGTSPTLSAVALNIAVTGAGSSGYLTAWPEGTAMPTTSSLNFVAGAAIANLDMVRVGTGGRVDIYNGSRGTVQIIADELGYVTG